MAADTLGVDTIVAILRRRAQTEPDSRAYVFLADGDQDERVITYGDLDRQARRIARRLLTSNRPGDRVLLLYPPGVEFIAGFFGALYAGLVAVPAYPPRNNSHVPRLEAIMADATVTEALTTAKTLSSVTTFVADHPRFGTLRWVTTDDLDSTWDATDADGSRGGTTESLALLQYTSGSTGTPKGVMVSHANIAHNSRYIQHCFSLDRSSVSATWLPSFHDMGLIDGVIQPLFTGFLGVILPPVSFVQQPVRWLRAIARYRATHGGGPNFGYELCVDKITEEQSAGLDLSCWRSAYNGAEPVRADTLRRFADRFAANGVRLQTLYPCYGMAETTLMVSGGSVLEDPVFCAVNRRALEQHHVQLADTANLDPTQVQWLVSSGRTHLDTRVRIVHPDTGHEAAPTEVGEVWVDAPSVCQGYWQRPDATQETFQAFAADGSGPYLRTGDLGFVREDELFITGRTKDLIIVRGRNLYPQDVEAVVDTAHPAVRPGAGTAFSIDQDGTEQLVIVQEVKRRAVKAPPVDEIAHAIVTAVANVHEVPVADIVLIKTGTIPKTSSGKLQRRRSRELFLNDELNVVGRWSARATTVAPPAADPITLESWLTTRVAERLRQPVTAVDPTTPFSQLGLDSLAMVELSGALATFVNRELAPTLLYDFPTIRRLAAHIAGNGTGSQSTSPTPASTDKTDEPIAIVGISCRLPGNVASVDDFWNLLIEGRDAIGGAPVGRWPAGESSAPPFAGTLADVDRFDPEFFGIAPREAAAMDPQHRLLLELTWEALEHGGIRPDTLSGTSTGVFVGISTQDYLSLQLRNNVSAYTGSGNALSAAAGRVSYLLGLEGPSLAVDTACSSSLVAVHLACQSLRTGESSAALVGGVNLLITPTLGEAFAKAGMMAADGRCKTFDARADGYVRSEGGVVIVLKPLSQAQTDGHRILGVIRGSAINQDGRSNGLTAPNGPSQERVIRAALTDARLPASEVSYVEAHGTGTPLGDPIEVLALGSVFADRQTPLVLGSAKTNVGHTEAAAGLVGLLKAALVLERGTIPATLHQVTPNPHIPWSQLPITVPTTPTPWPGDASSRRHAGVSSFGFTGTNAHVILEQPPVESPRAASVGDDGGRHVHVLAISAPQRTAVETLAHAYAEALDAESAPDGADVCYTASVGRAQFDHRLAVVGTTTRELAHALRARTTGRDTAARAVEAPIRVAWMFTGQGAQRPGMGARLYATEPVFRHAIDQCDDIFGEARSVSLRSLVGIDPVSESPTRNLDDTEWTQPALFALEYALAQLWQHWGQEPFAVIGHSIGEYVAATVAGVFPVEDALRLVSARGRVMQALPSGGGMLSVFGDEAVAGRAAEGWADVAIAAVNASDETVLSGPASSLDRIAEALSAQGIKSRRLTVSHAFHSPLMVPAVDAFADALASVHFSQPRLDVISNLTGDIAGSEIATPEYWIRHLLEPVRFLSGLKTLHALGVTHFLELGPAPVLTSLGARSDSHAGDRPGDKWLASLRPSVDESTQMLTTLGRLYESGASVNWEAVHAGRDVRFVSLPSYPFQRERYWVSDSDEALIDRHAGLDLTVDQHPLLGRQLPAVAALPQTVVWELRLSGRTHWQSYEVGARPILPTSAYLEMVEAAGQHTLDQPCVDVVHLTLVDAEFAQADDELEVQVTCTRLGSRSADVAIHLRSPTASENAGSAAWIQAATATVTAPAAAIRLDTASLTASVPPIDMGVMFFNGSDTGEEDRYRLVVETARFADREGFSSVWVPERHYTPFGGLYPNPSVLHAALARETRHVRLMAGSIVLPLHHPLRAIEDWALVDNLSHGRAGLSIASGWNPDDFAMHPDRYADRRDRLFAQIPLLRQLWRGERVSATSGTGKSIEVRTYPAPVQSELPLWVTAAGNPASFAKAGEVGAHLLTHLLDQDAAELATKIAIYREARAQHGHPPDGRVTVMIHTFLGDDVETVRELVREPYCRYIKENIGLLKGLAYSRGEELDLDKLSPSDIDEFVGFLYDRFFATRALLGTPDSCLPLIRQLADAGVNEIACLVDFGPPTSLVVRHLPYLASLHDRLAPATRVPLPPPPAEAVASIQSRCPDQFAAPAFYRQLRSRGIAVGELLQGAEHFWRRDGEALVRLTPAPASHPRTLETALQAFVAAIPSDVAAEDGKALFVASALRGLDFLTPNATATWSHATLDPATLTGALTMLDNAGAPVARLAQFSVRRIASDEAGQPSEDTGAYEVVWEAKPRAVTPSTSAASTWLLLADRGGLVQSVAARLNAAGYRTRLIDPDDVSDKDDAWLTLIRTAIAEQGSISGVLHGWSLDAAPTGALTDAALLDAQEHSCGTLLHLVKVLATLEEPPRLWCLTRNAQAAGSDVTAPINIAQSLVWGFGRAIAVEHPDVWGGAIDLDEASAPTEVDDVVGELTAGDPEDQVAHRSGVRLVPRLVPRDLPAQVPGALPELLFDPTASYVITGGVGGLGQRVARWMIDSGATDVVLTGLRERDGVPIEVEHRDDGVRIEVVAADASNRSAMSALIDGIAARGKVLKGVVHLAGVPEDTPIVDNDIDAGRRVLSPKVAGGWIIHDITRHLPLDFFVSFSSISAAWGSRGQPFYGAANHFLDALTAYRRQLNLPAVTVSWGPWSEGGMVDADGLARLERMGLRALPPHEAMARLARLVAAQSAPRVVVDVNWPVFKELFESRGPRPLLAHVGLSKSRGGQTQTALAQSLHHLDRETRQTRLVQYVHQQLAEVLGWSADRAPEPRRGFFDLGMDSLMALDLKNRLQDGLGLSLRATVVFNYSTIDSLAGFLAAQIAPNTEAPRTTAASSDDLGEDTLSDAETLRLLDEQLASIDSAESATEQDHE